MAPKELKKVWKEEKKEGKGDADVRDLQLYMYVTLEGVRNFL